MRVADSDDIVLQCIRLLQKVREQHAEEKLNKIFAQMMRITLARVVGEETMFNSRYNKDDAFSSFAFDIFGRFGSGVIEAFRGEGTLSSFDGHHDRFPIKKLKTNKQTKAWKVIDESTGTREWRGIIPFPSSRQLSSYKYELLNIFFVFFFPLSFTWCNHYSLHNVGPSSTCPPVCQMSS